MKNILYQFIVGRTHFTVPRGARITLALNEPKIGYYLIKFEHYLQAYITSGNNLLIMYAKLPMKIICDQLPAKSPIELKHKSNASLFDQLFIIHHPYIILTCSN